MVIRKPARPSKKNGKPVVDNQRKPFWQRIVDRAHQIPEEELASYPPDGAANIHHYLYGHPKQGA